MPAGPIGQGLNAALGVRIDEASPSRVVVRLVVDDRHLQPMGLVHGGVYASLAETAASIGASLDAMSRDPTRAAVGLENHTPFLRSARHGAELVATAVPRHAGRRTQSWTVTVVEADSDREIAMSTVRLMVVGQDLG